jgi:hypothetical protein
MANRQDHPSIKKNERKERVRTARAPASALLELYFERELHRSRRADLVKAAQSAIGAA